MKGWRTIVVNVCVILAALFNLPEFVGFTPLTAEQVVAILGVVNVILRFLTTTPVGGKTPVAPNDGGF